MDLNQEPQPVGVPVFAPRDAWAWGPWDDIGIPDHRGQAWLAGVNLVLERGTVGEIVVGQAAPVILVLLKPHEVMRAAFASKRAGHRLYYSLPFPVRIERDFHLYARLRTEHGEGLGFVSADLIYSVPPSWWERLLGRFGLWREKPWQPPSDDAD